ncbi:hypothetical protein AX17_004437 [Amanita inopinata Kibby_2008]|nr:hypothetical protein AX17_004437 [Amanita inopinata Kibby_2008]
MDNFLFGLIPTILHSRSSYFSSQTTLVNLTGKIHKIDKSCFAFGSSADIWKGARDTWRKGSERQIFAVKVIRAISYTKREHFEQLRKRLLREARVWSRLNHPHIAPFYGVSLDFDRRDSPCLVYPYYKSGDLVSYLKTVPKANRLQLTCQIACGLVYLHGLNPQVVHGDIKGSNVLINDRNEACLSDFGLGRILDSSGFTTKNVAGTCRWMAREMLDGEDDTDAPVYRTTETDIWAFGMTILEILTGNAPFSHLDYDASVVFCIVKGRLPRQPPEISDELWSLLRRCWSLEPEKRPKMASIALYLDFLYMGVSAPEDCERMVERLADLEAKPGKYAHGGSNSMVYCNWPTCMKHYETLAQCQAHEQEHWDDLLDSKRGFCEMKQ